MCARRAPGKLLIVRLETSIAGQRLSIAHHARRPHIWGTTRRITSRMATNRIRARRNAASGGGLCRLQESERCLARLLRRPSIAFVHDLAGRRKRLMLDRSLQIEFDSYRKTLSTADRLAFDECIERLLSQHGIDYVRGYVAALKERGSR